MKSKEFLTSLTKLAESLRQTIEASFTGWDDNPQSIAERRANVFDPVGGFKYFLAHYVPHYIRNPELSELHKYLHKVLPEVASNPESCLEAIAAPVVKPNQPLSASYTRFGGLSPQKPIIR